MTGGLYPNIYLAISCVCVCTYVKFLFLLPWITCCLHILLHMHFFSTNLLYANFEYLGRNSPVSFTGTPPPSLRPIPHHPLQQLTHEQLLAAHRARLMQSVKGKTMCSFTITIRHLCLSNVQLQHCFVFVLSTRLLFVNPIDICKLNVKLLHAMIPVDFPIM